MAPGTIGPLADVTAGPKGADSENRLSGEKFDGMTWTWMDLLMHPLSGQM